MAKDIDRTKEDLIIELAKLRAQLYVCEEALEKEKHSTRKSDEACVNEFTRLREVNEKLDLANMIVENSPAVLFRRLAGEPPTLVYVSENISQWGYSARDFLDGKITYRDILVEEDIQPLRDDIERRREQDVDEYVQEYRIKTVDGDIRWVSDQTSVVRDESGERIYNQGVVMDITRRKDAEHALAKSEDKFRRTIEGAGEGYLLMDKELVILEVNDAYCDMLGYSREELLGKRPHDFATIEYRRFLETNRKRLKAMTHRRFEGSMIAKDGHVVPILVNANTLKDKDGVFIGHVSFVADLTEQKKALELAGEVQKSLLPDKAPIMAGLDVAGLSIPSEIAGGDYYDYFEDRDKNGKTLGVAVGDISGHGVDAALLMTTARGFLRMRAGQPGTPAQIVTEMNHHLATDLYGTGRFMTLFLLLLDPENQSAKWVRAGHDPAFIYCPQHDAFTEMSGAGLPLGVIMESEYEEHAQDLLPGQIIAIGTDGIWEARNPQGEMFGKERFKDVLRKTADQPAQAILDAVFAEVKEFTHGARADDDATLVIVKYGFTS